jgi:hypothetical protein
MRETTYGKKMGQVLKAVASMHSQVSQLLSDCDGLFATYESVFASTATSDLTYNVKAKFWMAQGVFRYWFKEGQPVAGITIIFHPWEGEIEQPLLVVGGIEYLSVSSENVREVCNRWDLWNLAMVWALKPLNMGEVISLTRPDSKRTIEQMKAVVVPLFHVESLDDVKTLFAQTGVELDKMPK